MAEHYYNDPSLCSLHHDERRTQNLQKVLPPYYYTLLLLNVYLGLYVYVLLVLLRLLNFRPSTLQIIGMFFWKR
jgi:hypothetical protein